MRRVLILVACALLLGATIGFLLQKEQTYVLISTKSISFEMTIWMAIIVYLLSISFIISILLLISWILGGSGFKSWLITRKKRKNLLETTKGLIYFSDYDWKNSLTSLEKSASSSLMPSVNYIYAAKAAAEIDDYDRAYQSLTLLKKSDPTSSILVEKIRSELLLREERFQEAIQISTELMTKLPKDTGNIRILIDCYYITEDWTALQRLLPHIKKNRALVDSSFESLELETYENLLKSFRVEMDLKNKDNREKADDVWEAMPKHIQNNPVMIASYFDLLKQIDDTGKLSSLMIKSIEKSWNDDLVRRLGSLNSSAPEKIISVVEKWLIKKPENVALLTCLGDICVGAKLLGKGHDYYCAAINIEPSPSLFFKLGNVLSAIGDKTKSTDMFKEGLEFSISER
tara:strand:+ start:2242 stop:3447 length:1206 start_codon:yes stop_codon:yes gene_type:complete